MKTTIQLEAGYRVALKRIIRAAVGVVDNEAPTDKLEAQIKGIVKLAPAVVARGIDAWFKEAAKAWVRGNNSGSSRTMGIEEQNCDNLRDRAERVLKLWDVKVYYPGLYPCFNWGGHDYHSALSLMRAISEQ